jgi:hypothetical protein
MDEQEKLARLQRAVRKLAGWVGTDISDLIEDGILEEGDLDV